MIHRRTIITLFTLIFVAFSTKADKSVRCNRTCGTDKGYHKDVLYPFGFSDGCEIRLNCTDGDIRIGEYKVQNITGDNIMINIPAECNRTIQKTKQLFSPHYALTWHNGLMLKNCASPLHSCRIPRTTVKAEFESRTCGLQSDNISCYSSADNRLNYATYEKLEGTHCRFLFTSIAVYESNDSDKNSTVSLQFQAAELEWWLNGQCRCSKDADCKSVRLSDRKQRFRCRCKDGYEGDGFADGHGCRRLSDCSTSKYITGRCGGAARFGILIGGIIAGALLMAAVSLICYFIRRRSTSRRKLMSARRLVSEAAGCSSVPFYPYKEIERATNSFSEKQRLGTGAYGTVYAGKLHNDEFVAIKKIRHRDIDGIEQVMNEIKLLSSVSHPNLVRLLGCCIENGEQILIYEFMPNGTLSQHLQREKGKGLPWTIRLTIATDTANAIAYLHSVINPPIYHRDIKSSNILLDFNFKSKVADFGLSRIGMTDDSHISTAPQGTPGYVDPQYHQNFHLSDKSDVYSFGVVLVEIITALKVVDFSRPHSEVNLAALAVDRIGKGHVDEIIDPFLDPNRDAWTLSSIHKVAELAFRCLAFHRDMRPSMTEVADELEQIRLSGWAPMEENTCMALSVASTCSSPYNGSEKSLGGILIKKAAAGSQRLIVPQRPADCLTSLDELKDSSPVSVQDPWQSEHSSPSTNSLLGNVAR